MSRRPMHIFFSGVGGTGIGPLALIAYQAGYDVSGSDKQPSAYIDYLRPKGLSNIHIGQQREKIEKIHQDRPIDWIVFSSAVLIENPNHPELAFAKENGVKVSKRDEFTNKIIEDNGLKLIAVAGTHGKTTTTAMAVWLLQQLNIPISYSVGAKFSFGDMGHFDLKSEYFVYECDEFERNFLAFHPYLSLITGIDWDHHEIYPTKQGYQEAFKQFLNQSKWKIVWQNDLADAKLETDSSYLVLDEDEKVLNALSIPGFVNRKDAWQVIQGIHELTKQPIEKLIEKMEQFPGLSRRFEKIADNLYTDYAHTIPKIKGCLQLASELSKNVVVIYEPLTNRRQHHIANDYKDIFKDVKKLYWVPSYLAREDSSQETLRPEDLIKNMDNSAIAEPAQLDDNLKNNIKNHLSSGDLVVCLSGGGGGSLDEWVRKEFRVN